MRSMKKSDVCNKLEEIFIAINKDIKIRDKHYLLAYFDKHYLLTYLYLKLDVSLYRLDQKLDELLKHGVP